MNEWMIDDYKHTWVVNKGIIGSQLLGEVIQFSKILITHYQNSRYVMAGRRNVK